MFTDFRINRPSEL